MTPAERHAWIVRWLLLWSTYCSTPRVCLKDNEPLEQAYELRGCNPAGLAPDLAHLRAEGLLAAKRTGRRTVYWLADVKAAKAWAAQQPEDLVRSIYQADS